VQISAHYTRDLKWTYRITARLRRGTFRLFRALGVLLVLLAVLGAWSAAFPARTAVAYAVLGIVIAVMPDASIWLSLLRNKAHFASHVDVEITDRGISSSSTASQSTTIEWGMVRHVLDTGDCWVFVASRLLAVTVYKAALTPVQRSQLTTFLDTRSFIQNPI
jgi:hypothetical protein